MTWEQTHRRMDALREIEAELERTQDGTLPWKPEYREIFGDAAGLLAALRNRWALMLAAQVEQIYDLSGKPSATVRSLADQHKGLLRAITAPAGVAMSAPRTLMSKLPTAQQRDLVQDRTVTNEEGITEGAA